MPGILTYDKMKPGDKIPFSMFLDNQVYDLIFVISEKKP